MTKEQLKNARTLKSEIWGLERYIKDINNILFDYENFGSKIEFKRNKDGYSRSFGSKKGNFKEPLKLLLEDIRKDKEQELKELNKQFENL